MDAIGRWGSVQIDCADPAALASFWAGVLGSDVDETIGDPPHCVVVTPTAGGGPWLSFQRVPEAKVVKNRLHLDVVVGDLDAGLCSDRGPRGSTRPRGGCRGVRHPMAVDGRPGR